MTKNEFPHHELSNFRIAKRALAQKYEAAKTVAAQNRVSRSNAVDRVRANAMTLAHAIDAYEERQKAAVSSGPKCERCGKPTFGRLCAMCKGERLNGARP